MKSRKRTRKTEILAFRIESSLKGKAYDISDKTGKTLSIYLRQCVEKYVSAGGIICG